MRDNWNASIAKVLESEGSFVNHPKDPSGVTNLGVTKKVYEAGEEASKRTRDARVDRRTSGPFVQKRVLGPSQR